MVSSAVRNLTIIMVTLLCGRVLSERALQPLLERKKERTRNKEKRIQSHVKIHLGTLQCRRILEIGFHFKGQVLKGYL